MKVSRKKYLDGRVGLLLYYLDQFSEYPLELFLSWRIGLMDEDQCIYLEHCRFPI